MSDRNAKRTTGPEDEEHLTLVRSLDEIPDFASEEEEARWWETHELSDALWASGEQIGDPLLPPVQESRGETR